jgi:hypothetical protein
VSEDFCFVFFQESPSSKPLKITLGSFEFFLIRRDICKSRCTTGINDTGGKFATGVNNIGGNFATCGNFADGGKLPAVSTAPKANLPLVSTTPVANNGSNIRLQTH